MTARKTLDFGSIFGFLIFIALMGASMWGGHACTASVRAERQAIRDAADACVSDGHPPSECLAAMCIKAPAMCEGGY